MVDLGALWFERHKGPLPLGGIVIRKSLGEQATQELTQIYRSSIEYALSHRREALLAASTRALAGFAELKLADQYISMYVNERSLDLQPDVLTSLDRLFKVGSKRGLYPRGELPPFEARMPSREL